MRHWLEGLKAGKDVEHWALSPSLTGMQNVNIIEYYSVPQRDEPSDRTDVAHGSTEMTEANLKGKTL